MYLFNLMIRKPKMLPEQSVQNTRVERCAAVNRNDSRSAIGTLHDVMAPLHSLQSPTPFPEELDDLLAGKSRQPRQGRLKEETGIAPEGRAPPKTSRTPLLRYTERVLPSDHQWPPAASRPDHKRQHPGAMRPID